MKIRTVLALAIAVLMLNPVGTLLAADKDQDRDQDNTQQMGQVQIQDHDKMMYGWELMSVEERAQHRAKMQSFNTEQEREAYRNEHHKLMQARAKERGVTIPDVPRSSVGPGPGASGSAGGGGSGGGTGKGK